MKLSKTVVSERLSIRERQRGWLYAALGMLVVSTDSFFVRWSGTEVWNLVFWVALFSLGVYFVMAWRNQEPNPLQTLRHFPLPVAVIALLATVSQVCYITAVTRTTVANVVVIVGASPVIVALVGRVFFAERASRRVWVAIFVTFLGMVVIVAGSLGEPNLDGDLLAVVAVVAFSLSVNVWRRLPQMSRVTGLSAAAILSVLVASFFASPLSLDAQAFVACVGMGIFNPLGRLLHTNAPRYAPAAEVALFTPVETIAASLWAFLAFAEVPSLRTVIGATVIIAGVLYGTVTVQHRIINRQ